MADLDVCEHGYEYKGASRCRTCSPPITVREAARRAMPLDGADAQALEAALCTTERERDQLATELHFANQARTDLRLGLDRRDMEIDRLKAEINARKGDPVTRLHNLARGLEQPLGCGHDLADWCDNCETCGSCRDEARSASNG